MTDQNTDQVRTSYDSVAGEYARHLYQELRCKPLDRQLLDKFVERVRGKGISCDFGCGPGQVATYLHEQGAAVCGVDLSPRMVELARQMSPDIEFMQGDILALDMKDESWAGIAAFYAIVNLPPNDLAPAMREMYRTLQPEGWLLLSYHIGEEKSHVDDLWGCAVSLDFYFFRTEQVTGDLQRAGFKIEEVFEREPYSPEVEYQSRRAHVFARRPADIKTL